MDSKDSKDSKNGWAMRGILQHPLTNLCPVGLANIHLEHRGHQL